MVEGDSSKSKTVFIPHPYVHEPALRVVNVLGRARLSVKSVKNVFDLHGFPLAKVRRMIGLNRQNEKQEDSELITWASVTFPSTLEGTRWLTLTEPHLVLRPHRRSRESARDYAGGTHTGNISTRIFNTATSTRERRSAYDVWTSSQYAATHLRGIG